MSGPRRAADTGGVGRVTLSHARPSGPCGCGPVGVDPGEGLGPVDRCRRRDACRSISIPTTMSRG
jgi:hypothetical protein